MEVTASECGAGARAHVGRPVGVGHVGSQALQQRIVAVLRAGLVAVEVGAHEAGGAVGTVGAAGAAPAGARRLRAGGGRALRRRVVQQGHDAGLQLRGAQRAARAQRQHQPGHHTHQHVGPAHETVSHSTLRTALGTLMIPRANKINLSRN